MGLVEYDSSDEDEDVKVPSEKVQPEKPAVKAPSSESHDAVDEPQPVEQPTNPPSLPDPIPKQQPTNNEPPVLGPALGPSLPNKYQEVDMSFLEQDQDPSSSDPPKSPYTTTRTLLHDLSLPPILPDLSIPPSPPGSPTQSQAALTAKFDNFLKLKRTKGIHFNERLAGNIGMRNPALAEKLLQFVGFDTEIYGEGLVEAYKTVLDKDVTGWDPEGFPQWARCGDLRWQQERLGVREKGGRVEFVSAAAAASLGSMSFPGPVTGKRKGRWEL
ncbi:hypothetical protein QBC44DRAFT_384689 [Cladorrhinum sp. PSN332]|nr:hypothetical protein QBC44DRAFT_384689 [Cladorrhinum sp. PSN332]